MEYKCKKCENGTLKLNRDRLVCNKCFAYWENTDGKWKFQGYLVERQQTTAGVLPGPRRIQKTTQQVEDKKKTLACDKCNYKWKSKSVMMWVTCPSCQYKFKQK